MQSEGVPDRLRVLRAYAELERHPCFESLHGEERFQHMMAGVKTKVEEMRRRVDALVRVIRLIDGALFTIVDGRI